MRIRIYVVNILLSVLFILMLCNLFRVEYKQWLGCMYVWWLD